jgi:plasmid stabilization system protein ParE
MRVRWTTDAADDLERICDYIAEAVLKPRDKWRSPWSSASARWRRSRISGAPAASTALAKSHFLRSRSSPFTKFATNG